MILYPQLLQTPSRELVDSIKRLNVGELESLSAVECLGTIYSPTGGSRARREHIQGLKDSIEHVARTAGYPESQTTAARGKFDSEASALLHSSMDISPTEASREGVWAFLGCVVLPHVVRWRFGLTIGGVSADRFLGRMRGMRNTFGRLWWRGYLLHDSHLDDPYMHVSKLGEDEIVQITERPTVAGNRPLSLALCKVFLEAIGQLKRNPRSELLRDAIKRLRRLTSVIEFQAVSDEDLRGIVQGVFDDSLASLGEDPQKWAVDVQEVAPKPESGPLLAELPRRNGTFDPSQPYPNLVPRIEQEIRDYASSAGIAVSFRPVDKRPRGRVVRSDGDGLDLYLPDSPRMAAIAYAAVAVMKGFGYFHEQNDWLPSRAAFQRGLSDARERQDAAGLHKKTVKQFKKFVRIAPRGPRR